MTTESWLTLAILAVTFALLIRSRVPPVAVFVGALTLTITFRLAPLDQSLRGFSNPGMLTIGVLLMVATGMYRTGAISLITERLVGRPKTLLAAQLKILPPVAVGSAFLNNTPLVAMFIPVIRDLTRTSRLAAGRLYMPLSFASILGGTCTLIGTSTNLIIAGMITALLAQGEVAGLRPITMFDPALVGVPVLIAGLFFVIVFSRVLLPEEGRDTEKAAASRWYRAEFHVAEDAPVVGRTVDQMGWGDTDSFQLVAWHRAGGESAFEEPSGRLRAGDHLAFAGDLGSLPGLWNTTGLEPAFKGHASQQPRFTHRLVEVVLSPRSAALGRMVAEIPMEGSPYNINLLGLSRDGRPLAGPLAEVSLESGDVGLLEVDENFFTVNQREEDFSLTRRVTGARVQRYERAAAAMTITAAMVAVVALGWLPMLTASLLAVGAMLLTGCMTPAEAGRSVDWSTLTIIASAIGLEAAVTGSGLSDQIAGLLTALGGGSNYAALAAVFLGCILMDTMITNVASAVFMFPIAMAMAGSLGVSAMPFAMTVLVGASCSFISPMGYQTNLMVYGPGGYRFMDFVKMGVPLTVVVGAVTVFLAPLAWPF